MTSQAILPKDSVFLEPTLAAKRARYYSQENNFDFSWPEVPVHQFANERNLAMQPGRSTGLVPLDLQSVLGLSYPATTPTLLVRYVNIRGKDSLTTDFVASGTVCYVIRGEGVTTDDVETILPPVECQPQSRRRQSPVENGTVPVLSRYQRKQSRYTTVQR